MLDEGDISYLEQRLTVAQFDKVMKYRRAIEYVSVEEINRLEFKAVLANVHRYDGHEFYVTEYGDVATTEEIEKIRDMDFGPDKEYDVSIPLLRIRVKTRLETRKS